MRKEEKIATGVYLPKQIIHAIDLKRGRISRSTYIAILLEKLLIKRKQR
jgi:hypothetical protein